MKAEKAGINTLKPTNILWIYIENQNAWNNAWGVLPKGYKTVPELFVEMRFIDVGY